MDNLTPSLHALWGQRVALALCERCDERFLVADGTNADACPHCYHAPLTALTPPAGDDTTSHPPELVLPFSAPSETVAEQLGQFVRSIPFAPPDLTAERAPEPRRSGRIRSMACRRDASKRAASHPPGGSARLPHGHPEGSDPSASLGTWLASDARSHASVQGTPRSIASSGRLCRFLVFSRAKARIIATRSARHHP